MIRYHRQIAGLTQKELGDLAGTGKTVIFDIEKGKMTMKMNTLLKILDALNISVEFTSPIMDEFKSRENVNS